MDRRHRFEPSTYPAWLGYPVELNRPFDPLERLRAATFDYKQSGGQSVTISGYQDAVRGGHSLDTRCYVGCLAKYVGALAETSSYHDGTRIDADPRVQRRARGG